MRNCLAPSTSRTLPGSSRQNNPTSNLKFDEEDEEAHIKQHDADDLDEHAEADELEGFEAEEEEVGDEEVNVYADGVTYSHTGSDMLHTIHSYEVNELEMIATEDEINAEAEASDKLADSSSSPDSDTQFSGLPPGADEAKAVKKKVMLKRKPPTAAAIAASKKPNLEVRKTKAIYISYIPVSNTAKGANAASLYENLRMLAPRVGPNGCQFLNQAEADREAYLQYLRHRRLNVRMRHSLSGPSK
jgi:hypothetical protein